MVTKDIEDVNQEVSLLMETQSDILKDFKKLKRTFLGEEGDDDDGEEEGQSESDDGISNSLSEYEKKLLYVEGPKADSDGEHWKI